MRRGVLSSAPGFLLLLILFGGLSCEPARRETGGVAATRTSSRPSGAMSGCSICHVDVEVASKGSKHVAADIGCADCHGKSEGHVRDENNEVKPDRVFAPAEINSFCGDCHDCSLPADKRLPPKVCTDCHDAHALTVTMK